MLGTTIDQRQTPNEQRVGVSRITALELELAQSKQRERQAQGEAQRAAKALQDLEAERANQSQLRATIRDLEGQLIALRVRVGTAETQVQKSTRDDEELVRLREWHAGLGEQVKAHETTLTLERQRHEAELKRVAEERDTAIRERDEARKGGKKR